MKKTIGMEFMEQSQCRHCQDAGGETPPALRLPCDEAALIALPEPDLLDDKQVSFLEMIETRTSIREYHGAEMTLKELSCLLWCTQGIKMTFPNGASLRNVPSAGARHALETYLYIRSAAGLKPGIYRFVALQHALAPVDLTEETNEKLQSAFLRQPMAASCSVMFIWAAMLERMAGAYGQRAYRYLHLDAGHVCQNLYLAAQIVQFGACAIGHFDDEQLNALIGADGARQFAVYAASVGR